MRVVEIRKNMWQKWEVESDNNVVTEGQYISLEDYKKGLEEAYKQGAWDYAQGNWDDRYFQEWLKQYLEGK